LTSAVSSGEAVDISGKYQIQGLLAVNLTVAAWLAYTVYLQLTL